MTRDQSYQNIITVPLIKFNVTFLVLNQSDYVKSACAAIAFRNTGTNNLFINNTLMLVPGDNFIVNGNEQEIDETVYNVTFDPVGTGTNVCVIARKFYI